MGRELKFRAWHKTENKLCAIKVLTNEGAFLIGVKKDKDTISDRIIIYAPEEGRFCDFEEIEIMQSTGLSDKNSVEIWEGDIVKCGYGEGKVVFNAGCFMVEWIDDKEAYMEFVFSRKGTYIRQDGDQFEVIGNIYENR